MHKNSIPELSMHTDKCTPQYFFEKNFNVILPQRNFWENENPLDHTDINIYTDGSKTDTGSGFGIYSTNPQINISSSLGKNTTITQAETCAIIETCNILNSNGTHNKTINICSDSQASLKSINGHCFTSKLMIDCIDSLKSLSNSNRVNLLWVPAHSNVEGNEKADNLARIGSKTPVNGPEPTIGITYSTQRSLIRDFYVTQHQKLWKSLTNCKHSRTIIDGPNIRNTKFLLNKSRHDLRLIIGAITGHCKLNKHLHRMRLKPTATCRRCSEHNETPLHLLTSCPALIGRRNKIFGKRFLAENETSNTKLENILTFFSDIEM